MKFTTYITGIATAALLSLYSCESSDRTTGNESAAQTETNGVTDSNTIDKARPDTTVTGVSGNTNAVNAAGNAGNGSGMGSSSNTEANKKH